MSKAEYASEYVHVSKKNLEQDDRISEVETKFRLLEAQQGTVNLGESSKLIGISFVLISTISAIYVEWKTSPQVTDLALVERSISSFEEETAVLEERISAVSGDAKEIARTLIVEIEEDIARIITSEEKLEVELDELAEKIAATLDQEVLDERFEAVRLLINNVEGRFDRIINNRLTPLIDKLELRVSKLEERSIIELERQRDESPPAYHWLTPPKE